MHHGIGGGRRGLDRALLKPGVRKPAYDRVPAADVDAVVELLADS
jgi:hypothetical protein